MRKASVSNKSRAHVLGVMRNARRRDVSAFRIADNRAVSISTSEAPSDIGRDVRRRIGLKYLCESDGPFSRRLAPGEGSSTANYDEPVSLLRQPDRRLNWTRNMHVV